MPVYCIWAMSCSLTPPSQRLCYRSFTWALYSGQVRPTRQEVSLPADYSLGLTYSTQKGQAAFISHFLQTHVAEALFQAVMAEGETKGSHQLDPLNYNLLNK